MRKNNESTIRAIKRPWIGGRNQSSLYMTIPSEMVKKLGITQDSLLFIDVIDDSIITVKKIDKKTGLTRRELEKIRNPDNYEGDDWPKEENNMIGHTLPADFKNPLDELDDI